MSEEDKKQSQKEEIPVFDLDDAEGKDKVEKAEKPPVNEDGDEGEDETLTAVPTTLAGVDVKDIHKIIDATQSTLKAPTWSPHVFYNRGSIAQYNHVKFQCLLSHTSEPQMTPQYTPQFWKSLLF